jgi:thioredoxin-related protein
MAKVLALFEKKHGDIINVQIVNVREFPDVGRLYQVRFVPTLVFLDENGKMLEKRVGFMPLDALEKQWAGHGYPLDSADK